MANGHIHFKRIIHRVFEELDATRRIAKVTSCSDAFVTFRAKIDIQIMNRNGYKETEKIKKHLVKKHDVMMEYFEKTFSDHISANSFDVTLNSEYSKYQNCI